MNKEIIKRFLPVIALTFLCVPVAYSSFLGLEKKKADEIIKQGFLAQQLAREEAEEKIYLMGKFDPALRENFVLIPKEYTNVENKMYLRKETFNAFLKMRETAEENGVNLKIASAARSYDYQKNIWNNKWTGFTLINGKNLAKSIPDGLERFKKILEYSAVPGTSRHHWGTEIDINNANPPYFKTERGKKVYGWLAQNAHRFGFCQPYNLKVNDKKTGYNEEKWHWSYLPLAKTFTQEYKKLIKNEDINGFLGDEYIIEQDLINNYVLGINPDCL